MIARLLCALFDHDWRDEGPNMSRLLCAVFNHDWRDDDPRTWRVRTCRRCDLMAWDSR